MNEARHARRLKPAKARLLLLAALAAALLLGCGAQRGDGFTTLDTRAVRIPRECGVTLAMGSGRPARYREMPPACALPTVEEVARSCAVQDRVSAPDFVESDCDDATGVCTPPPTPLPDYRVSALDCRYTNGDESAASCRFRLALPGEAGEGRDVEVAFDHRFWADHGPAHHVYGTLWMLAQGADCTAEPG
jgi:hypothetical protein